MAGCLMLQIRAQAFQFIGPQTLPDIFAEVGQTAAERARCPIPADLRSTLAVRPVLHESLGVTRMRRLSTGCGQHNVGDNVSNGLGHDTPSKMLLAGKPTPWNPFGLPAMTDVT